MFGVFAFYSLPHNTIIIFFFFYFFFIKYISVCVFRVSHQTFYIVAYLLGLAFQCLVWYILGMNTEATRARMAAALKWTVQKYSAMMTDKQIAVKYGLPVWRIERTRQRLGLKKSGYRHKVNVV